jgi:hypothetical protein
MRSFAVTSMLREIGVPRTPLLIFLFLLLIATVAIGLGAEFWENDYRLWSIEECTRLLENSPWAKEYTLNQIMIMPKGNDNATLGTTQHQPYVKYTVQFQSAAPIRKALVRRMQIVQKYESMPDAQKQAFDRKAEAFISASSDESIVVFVEYTTNHPPFELDLAHYWQSQTIATFQNSVNLIFDKGRIPLVSYAPSQRGFQFTFPRKHNGKPVLTAKDKSIKLEFPYPGIGGNMDGGRALLEFKVKKMLINGNVVY